jgi:hypothetical protein
MSPDSHIPLFALQLTACKDDLTGPRNGEAGPQFLLGDSPLTPFWLAKAPALETKQNVQGQVERQLVTELSMTPDQADALEKGKRAFQSSAGFWIDGGAVALADPRPSPVVGLFNQKDGNKLVVIAMPLDDAAWSRIGHAAQAGETVSVIMDIDLLDLVRAVVPA